MSTTSITTIPAPSWADIESPQMDGTCAYMTDPMGQSRKNLYAMVTTQFWSTDMPATKAEIDIIGHRGELELDAAGIDQLITDLTAVRDALRAADREAGL